MPRGGAREGAGRRAGTPNRKTAELQEAVAKTGVTPLDYMLGVMRDISQEYPIRLDAAKSAAPYVHAKLAAIEHTGKDGSDLIPPQTEDRQVARAILALLATGAKDE